MNAKGLGNGLRLAALLCAAVLMAGSAAPAIKNMAVVASAGSKLQDVTLAELVKLCKGTQKTWADGRNFTLVIRDPESPDLRVAVQKLFGMPPSEVKSAIAKLNETRAVVRIGKATRICCGRWKLRRERWEFWMCMPSTAR